MQIIVFWLVIIWYYPNINKYETFLYFIPLKLKKTKCENAVTQALHIGYRHIDTAYLYRNEAIIGRILKEQIDQNKIKREDIFLATKLWNIYHEPERVKYSCKIQMEALKVNYIDLYLMHYPIGYKYVDDDALMPHEEDKLQTK